MGMKSSPRYDRGDREYCTKIVQAVRRTGQFRPLLSPIPWFLDGVAYGKGKSDTPTH